jgi:CheY-like chemotaxis protein
MGMALVVEDDPELRMLVSLVLEQALDERVVECESAEAAVAVLDECGGDVDVMVTDIELAGVMTGLELAAMARRRFPELNVIVTSGGDKPDALPDNTIFLPKPWRALDLIQRAQR